MRPRIAPSNSLVSGALGIVALSAFIVTLVTLGLFIVFRDDTSMRMMDDMSNIGTQGVGVYDSKLDHTFQMRNVAAGVGTIVTLDEDQNIVVGLDGGGAFDVTTDVGLQGGQTVSFGDTLALSLNAAQSFTMLAVSGSTLLGTSTSCIQPLSASCYDISNQGCTTPLLQSCIPSDLIVNNLMVYNLTLVNATTLDVPIGNQTALYVDELYVNNEQLSGSLTCANAGNIDNSCLNLGGYSCPIGVPLAESCIPASMIFHNLSVTNQLDINQVQCLGGPLQDACIGGTNLATPNTLVRRDSIAGFEAAAVKLNALTFVASTVPAGGITFGTDANLYRSAVNMLRTTTDLTVRHIQYSNAAPPTAVAGLSAGLATPAIITAGSTDCKMQLTLFCTGISMIGSQLLFTVHYNTGFTSSTPNLGVVMYAANRKVAELIPASVPFISYEDNFRFEVTAGTTALSSGTYIWNIMVC